MALPLRPWLRCLVPGVFRVELAQNTTNGHCACAPFLIFSLHLAARQSGNLREVLRPFDGHVAPDCTLVPRPGYPSVLDRSRAANCDTFRVLWPSSRLRATLAGPIASQRHPWGFSPSEECSRPRPDTSRLALPFFLLATDIVKLSSLDTANESCFASCWTPDCRRKVVGKTHFL